MSNNIYDQDSSAPARDKRGRFEKGSTGNPRGRPPKPAEQAWNLSRSIAQSLSEEVEITEGGVKKRVQYRDALIKSWLRSLAKAKPREGLLVFDWLANRGAFEPPPPSADEQSSILSDEFLQIIEEANRAVESMVCPKCAGPFPDEEGEPEDTRLI